MKKAASRELYEDDESSKQLAVVIPLHLPERETPKQTKKTIAVVKAATEDGTSVPGFTTPVFKPRKHDML